MKEAISLYRSLFTRLFATYLLLFACIITALTVSLTYTLHQHFFQRKQDQLYRQGDQLNQILESSPKAQWEQRIEEAESLLGARIVAQRVDTAQADILDSYDLSRYGDSHLVTDVKAILAGERVSRSKQYSPLLKTEVVYVGQPLLKDGEIDGFILLFAPLSELGEALRLVNIIMLLHVLGGLVASVCFIYPVSRRISRPLATLEKAARHMAEGRYSGLVSVRGKDELARLAAAFNHMAARLARTDKLRQELFSDIAHELRSPITTVRGFLQALREGVVPENEKQLYLDSAFQEAGRLSRLVNDLLELVKLQEGQFMLKRETVVLAPLVEDLLQGYYLQATEKKLHFSCLLEPSIQTVFADPDRLRQILINLLDNAFRYTETGGTVILEISRCDEGIEVIVKDSGCGIPPDEMPFIFEKFYRIDRARDSSSGGAGLGLSIVRKLVEAHGGYTIAASVPGSGSTIGFCLLEETSPQ